MSLNDTPNTDEPREPRNQSEPNTKHQTPNTTEPNTKHQTPNTNPPNANRPPLVRNTSLFRTLLTVGVMFAGLFLVVRTVLVEPFGVPTGSMAPALIGHHREGPCTRCGFPVRVGRTGAGGDNQFLSVCCPNCEQYFSLAAARDLSGDRLLVDKNVYALRNPRRWEMVVFHCPDTDPNEFGKPYVKRLIGLPGETITVVDGDAYVKVAPDERDLLRKGLAEVRETTIPVFDMNYAPSAGWGVRWVTSAPADKRLPAGEPAVAAPAPAIEGNALVLDASAQPQTEVGVSYRHFNLDVRREEPVRVWSAYDGPPRGFGGLPAARDFVFSCDIEVTAAHAGEASFAVRLMDGADAVEAELSAGPRKTGRATLTRADHGGLGAAGGVALVPGTRYKLEFAFVDRRVLLALDGKLVVPAADLPPVTGRKEVSRPLQLGARGCRVVLRNVKLGRDIHYTHYGEHGTRRAAELGPREYYVLGDNSGNSQDSRKWPQPAVPERAFIGKPILVHQPLRNARVTVNGREREFQSLDWSRMRWLH
jgi:signal peptidase I